MPGASWRSKETWSHYRKRFRGALHTWAKAMYGDQAVLTNLLRYGFTACCPDTPAKALGTAIHLLNDHAKQNRKDKSDNRKTELQEYQARKVRRALRFGKITVADLTADQKEMLRQLNAGELRKRVEKEDFASKLVRVQGHMLQ